MTGAAISRFGAEKRKLILLSILCAILPDADVITFKFGIQYGDFFGHRGFFHSIAFAVIIGMSIPSIFYRSLRTFSFRWFKLSGYYSIVTISHGVLDAFTNGGLGIALLSPFDNTRYFFWVTPIEVVTLNPMRFFSLHGIQVMANEFLWVWLPCLALIVMVRYMRKKKELKDLYR